MITVSIIFLPVRTLYSHNGPVWAIERKGDLLLSGSQDKTAKLWDIRRYRLLLTLSGHTAAIFAVDIDDSISVALTGSADRVSLNFRHQHQETSNKTNSHKTLRIYVNLEPKI